MYVVACFQVLWKKEILESDEHENVSTVFETYRHLTIKNPITK